MPNTPDNRIYCFTCNRFSEPPDYCGCSGTTDGQYAPMMTDIGPIGLEQISSSNLEHCTNSFVAYEYWRKSKR